MADLNYESSVIVLSDYIGPLAQEIRAMKVKVLVVPFNRRPVLAIFRLFRLMRLLSKEQPDVVQTWMYHADLIGGLATKIVTQAPLVWGVHNDGPSRKMKLSTRALVRICAFFSHFLPEKIICCSERCRDAHAVIGYKKKHLTVVSAGIDTKRFRPGSDSAVWLRRKLGLSPEAPIVGMIARFTPEKDLDTFCKAAVEILKITPSTRFVLCGQGMVNDNAELKKILIEAQLEDKVFLIGIAEDVVRIIQGLTLSVLSSSTEAFGLVVAESLACGVISVGTDVGEVKRVIGRSDFVVPRQNPKLLARACLHALALPEREKCIFLTNARKRIESDYSVMTMAQSYRRAWSELLIGRAQKESAIERL